MKKRIIAIVICVILIAGVAIGIASCSDRDADKLIVYNWEDYIYEDFQKDFAQYYKKATGRSIKVTYVTFDTNEVLLTKILNNDAKVDVMCPSEYAIQRLLEGNYLLKLDYFTDPAFKNSKNIDSQIVSAVKNSYAGTGIDLADYFAPYMWGTLGILYNSGEISKAQAEAAGWGLLWNDNGNNGIVSDKLNGKIFMKDSVRDAYMAAVMYMKQKGTLPEKYKSLSVQKLINVFDNELIAAAEAVLLEQKEFLYGYEVDFGKDDLIAGNALVDLAWSGDAMYAIEDAKANGITLDYFIPTVGSNVWLDGWVIPKNAEHVAAAKLFIDFLNDPEVAAKNMMSIGYSSAVSKNAIKASTAAVNVIRDAYSIPDSIYGNNPNTIVDNFFNDTRRYPAPTSTNLGVMHDFGASNEKVVAMWERVRAEGASDWLIPLLIGIGAAAVVGIGVFVVVKLTGGRKRRRVVKK